MDDQLKGEYFIRQAFGFALNGGEWVDRWGDPAGLAEASVFSAATPRAKAAIIYATEIYRAKLDEMDSEEDYNFVQDFPENVLNASSPQEISDLLDSFRSTIINKYFEVDDGKIRQRIK